MNDDFDNDRSPTARLLSDTLNTDPPPDVEHRLQKRLESLRMTMESSNVAISSWHFRPRRWFAGLGAITSMCVVVMLLTSILFPVGSSRALGQIADAVATRKWLHASGTGLEGQPAEMWFSGPNGVLAYRSGESFVFVDQIQGTMDVFGEPFTADSVRRMPIERVQAQGIRNARRSFLPLLTGDLQQAMKSGNEKIIVHEEKKIEFDGREWVEHRFVVTVNGSDEVRVESLLQVDPTTGLPMTLRIKVGEKLLGDFKVSYPDHGPLTIVALGAPATASVVDQSPKGTFKDILLATETARRRFDDYHAIVINSDTPNRSTNGSANLIWKKGNRWRIDAMGMFYRHEEPPPGADPETWWFEKAKMKRSYPVEIWDGKRLWNFQAFYSHEAGLDSDGNQILDIEKVIVTSGIPMDPNDPVMHFGSAVKLPERYAYESLNRAVFSPNLRALTREAELNGISMLQIDVIERLGSEKSLNFRYWFDPQRGYMEVRKENCRGMKFDQPFSGEEISAAARTPQGLWYPTTVRGIGSAVSMETGARSDWYERYYMEFGTEIPDELFNAEALDTKDAKHFWTKLK